ncbi:TonB-dependent receptor [Microbulbifer halophilus]|uniref:TonB-dependent receptor n=1 Tax=Microbulbifer halophilus TaxID=453963 RepID=A0ABW5E6Q1_9GAMM|nr:TonB-dependent receptor [Microbulbifer halophilus]MCW8126846.1 TonB-dependent receptor [Microbulbifer halophilus]
MKYQSKKILPLAIALASSAAFAQQDNENEETDYDASLEEVYVEGVRNAELNARAAERNKDNFSSIVTQDDAGNFSDQNAAELLRRMPGITLQKSEGEGKFVSLRGLGPGMVSVRMDGGVMANAGGGSNGDLENRAFSLDGLPTDVLQSIEVNKSLTPDMDLDAIGGSINVKTLSALDRGEDSIKLRAQNYVQDQAEENSPKLTLQGSNILMDDKLGVAYTASWEERTTQGYETRHHSSTLPNYVETDGTRMLVPWEFETRQENAERERVAALVNLEYEPDDGSRYRLKLNHTSYEDVDVALREYYRFNLSDNENVYYLDPAKGVFGGTSVDLQHQYFIQESKVTTNTFAFSGENRFGDGWEAQYEITSSHSENEKPDGRRVQFRVRELAALGRSDSGFVNGQIVDPDWLADAAGVDSIAGAGGHSGAGYQMGEASQRYMKYDNLFMENSLREDSVDQFTFDLRKDFQTGFVNYFKTGVNIRQRERNFDKNRASIVPEDKSGLGCDDLECVDMASSTLGDYPTFIPENGNFDHAFITNGAAEQLIAGTRAIGDNYDPGESEVESTRRDYDLSEDASAIYAMAEFQVLPDATLIAGARYTQTKFDSTGYFSIRNDRNESDETLNSFDIGLPLEDVSNEYGNFLPALHYRHELSERLLGRAALWTSYSRPDFGKSRAFFEVRDRVIFCNTDPESEFNGECNEDPSDIGSERGDLEYQQQYFTMSEDNTVRIGNPSLDPMQSTNLDMSLSWYGDYTFLEAALFYKDISDFIVSASGVNITISELGFDVPVEQVDLFHIDPDLTVTNAETYLNGNKAKVYGTELSFSHYFDGTWEHHKVGRWLDNIFVQANATLQQSDGDVGETVRVDSIQLPEQADTAANLTLGWENDSLSVRMIANYTGEILKRIGSCTAADMEADAALGYADNCVAWADVYQDQSTTFDIKATYRVNDSTQVYLDAINITDSVDEYFFAGNEDSGGAMLFDVEQYGPGYQLGLTMDF